MRKIGGSSGFNESKYIELSCIGEKSGNIQNWRYVEGVSKRLESDLPIVFDRETVLAGAMKRKLNSPKKVTAEGLLKGTWQGTEFVLDDNFVPKNINSTNPEHLTVRQIKEKLSEKYGIRLAGIPYHDGVADFHSISLANISTEEMFMTISGMAHSDYRALSQVERTKQFSSAFSKSKRESNFAIADRIASEKQIPIPGLSKGYTKEQLTKWRDENKFSWDEQIKGGYNLVPTIIHQNVSHTGLVSTAGNAYKNLKNRTQEIKEHSELYCWNDSDAPISINELRNYEILTKKQCKGEGKAMGKYGEVSYKEVKDTAGDKVYEGEKLGELAKQFVSDKNKLEDEIEKVQAANISDKDKAQIIAELNAAVVALQEQYDKDVVEEERKVQEELEGQIESMQEAADELERQVDSLRSVQMDVASTDASAAADAAAAQKQAFETMKSEYLEKLNLQIEQSEIQKRNILNRRLSGR